jgi:chromosomal replication initiation ATPase DnaA
VEVFLIDWGHWGRELVLYLGRKKCALRLRELGKAVGGGDYAAVSAAIKRFERRISQDKKVAQVARQADQLLKAET